jgi:hypothetical protein
MMGTFLLGGTINNVRGIFQSLFGIGGSLLYLVVELGVSGWLIVAGVVAIAIVTAGKLRGNRL